MVTSATCVTGLSVIDIGSRFTVWGQLTLLSCIQLGGLGIMTFSTVLVLALGRSISFRSRFIIQDVFAHTPQADFHVLLRRVILFTLSFETVGALLLFMRFRHELDGTGTAAYFAVFHSVSAFCNAGFGLFADNLMRYTDDFLVNMTIMGLIVSGGIGFMVLHELTRALEDRRGWTYCWRQLSLHTKIVITMTSILIAGGALFFLLSEWSNTLREFSLPVKLLASLFLSVTPRTAGFNTLDYAAMNNITLLGSIILMFIGASPGSTGGGIKTTTLGVMLALSRGKLNGSDRVHAFKRSVSSESVNRSLGVFILSVVIVMLGTAALIMSEAGAVPHQETRGLFMELLFETTSAFGTVGLSMGITPKLSAWSKFFLVLIMFTGRLGPLVIAMAIQPGRCRGDYVYAEERLMIG